MQINNLSSINFGYNAAYHANLHNRIRKSNDISDANKKSLISDDSLLLETEDDLIEAEQTPSKQHAVPMLSAYYIDSKAKLAKRMNIALCNDSYTNDLIGQYRKEIKENKSNNAIFPWRANLIAALQKTRIDIDTILDDDDNDNLIPPFMKPQGKQPEQFAAQGTFCIPPKQPKPAHAGASCLLTPPSLEEIEEANKANLSLFVQSKSSPNRGFADICGMDDLKQLFREDIVDYALNPELLTLDKEEYGIEPPHAFLLYGPPGCGKTYITQALAIEAGLRMYRMDVSKIGNIYVNSTAKNLDGAFSFLFDTAKGAKKPILLFLDEVDSIAADRNQFKTSGGEDIKAMNTLLKFFDMAKDHNMILIAATNRYDALDKAFCSRFDNSAYVGLPGTKEIKQLLSKHFCTIPKGQKLSQNEQDMDFLASMLSGYSNRSIVFILNSALKIARADGRSDIKKEHVIQAIEKCYHQKIDEKLYKREDERKVVIGF